MNFVTVQGIIITLLLLVPGLIGDGLMRTVTPMVEPKSDLARSLRAVAWSALTLALLETVYSGVADVAFGDYLIEPVTDITADAPVDAGLATRYALFVVAASVLPAVLRWVARRALIEKLTGGRTLSEPSLDRLLRYTPHSASVPYARIATENDSYEGWVRWSSYGSEVDAAYILRDFSSEAVTWVPISRVVAITLVDTEAEPPGTTALEDDVGE